MPRVAEAYRLHFEVQYVGRTIKSAKRRVTWKFAFRGDTEEHSVVLLHTINSGKKVIFLNGNQIFEEEKLSMATWQYPFQLEGHLLTIIIEAQISEEGMYELRVDGRPWADLKHTTLVDLRAANMGRVDESSVAWGRGGASATFEAAEGPARGWDQQEAEYTEPGADVPVPSKSLRDFIGESPREGGATAGRTARGSKSAAAPAAGGDSGAWDPFSGAAEPSSGGFDFPTSAPAPAPAHREHAAARTSIAKASPTHAAGPSHGLRPPPGATGGRSSIVGAATAAAHHHASAPAPAAAPVTSLADDLAGLSFGGAAPAQTASFSHDPFAPAPAAATGVANIFGSPAAPPPAAAPADPLYDSAKDLFDLDHLTAPKAGPAAPAAQPSLAQLAASKPQMGSSVPVMAPRAPMGIGLGASPMDLYAPAVPPGGGMMFPGGMAPRPMGMGFGPAPGGYPMSGMHPGFGAPQQQPKSAAEYNPFE